VLISKTWLHSDVRNGLLDSCAKYNIIRKYRKSCKGGGVCAFVSNRYKFVPVIIDIKFDDIDIVCFDCFGTNMRSGIRFFVIYRPSLHDRFAVSLMDLIIQCLTRYEHTSYTNVIVGDLNLPRID